MEAEYEQQENEKLLGSQSQGDRANAYFYLSLQKHHQVLMVRVSEEFPHVGTWGWRCQEHWEIYPEPSPERDLLFRGKDVAIA